METIDITRHPCSFALFTIVAAMCILPAPAFAQGCQSVSHPLMCFSQITIYTGEYGPGLPPRTAQCDCNGVPESFTNCYMRNLSCAPAPECPTCNTASHPVDLATGDTYITETDINNPGLGGGLNLTRTWNSVSFEGVAVLGMFGMRWTSSYEDSVFTGGDGFMKYMRPDGGIWSFGYTGQVTNGAGYAVAAPANETATLTEGASNWTMVFKNGEQRTFDLQSGKLLSITDRNGNTTQLTYDASYRLIKVTDPAGRHLNFTYGSPASFLVTGVSSDFGVSLSYSYDQLGRLKGWWPRNRDSAH
jgi:YD repeat-containing protein